MKKILYVHNANFDVIVANRLQVINMCNGFIKNNNKVTLLTETKKISNIKKNYDVNKTLKIKNIQNSWNYYIRTIKLIFRFLKLPKYDIIFTRDLLFSLLSKTLSPKSKVIYEGHEIIKNKLWKLLLQISSKKLDKIIVITNHIKEKMIELGIKNEKIYVAGDAVDIKKFDINISQKQARNKLKINYNHIVSYIGSTDLNRDITTLAATAKKLKHIDFLIYGHESKYLNKCKNKINNLHYMGFTKKPEIVCKASDILFSGYTKDVKTINYMSPLKIFEYMASKRPMILADFKRIREIVNDKETLFYTSENAKSLEDSIIKLIKNKELQKKLANNAFKKIKNNTWKSRSNEILKSIHESFINKS